MSIIATIIAALLPQNAMPVHVCEVAELNNVMQHQGDGEWEPRLTQIILWGTHPDKPGQHVREWIYARDLVIEPNARIPFVIVDGRVFKARVLCESWTPTDIEIDDREEVKIEQRVKLK